MREVEFVVVDLETTGGSPQTCEITEIGAVRVRGGEVLGEFQSLVRPQASIPAFIAVLTGITDAMVGAAPAIHAVLPAFLEFARGGVLVAHNAPFDMGFLRRNAERLALPWPAVPVVDTARLARRALSRDEAPNCKLATLAQIFRAETAPCHRALADAQATVAVLHALLERVGGLGVQSLEELVAFSAQVPDAVRRKRHLAAGLPHAPGVYVFRDAQDRPLYVGKATNLHTRVRSYFTAAETRRRMAEMVVLADRVQVVVCSTVLEAEVRELRAIRALQPRYNRRSRASKGEVWVRLTREAFPRLSTVTRRGDDDDEPVLGPFGNRRGAESVVAALHEAVPIRRCTGRIPAHKQPTGTACSLADLGKCGAPCAGQESAVQYQAHVLQIQTAISTDTSLVVDKLVERLAHLASAQRYEDAAAQRDRISALVRAAARRQRVAALVSVAELVAAAPASGGGWQLAVIRRGRLAATLVAPPGQDPYPYVRAARLTAETPGAGATRDESEIILRWLEQPGTRLVEVSDPWCSPARGAGRLGVWLTDPAPVDPFADRRGLRPAR